MALTGTEVLNRSQASAEAETGSIALPAKECEAWIGVSAVYDDPWATPVTGCQVRITVEDTLVADGPRTKGLSSYGREDGQPHEDIRSELGVYRQSGVKPGAAVIELVPDSTDNPKDIEEQIHRQLESFEMSMRQTLQPWLSEWSKTGWLSIPDAQRRGRLHGLGVWWEGEVGFWASAGNMASEVLQGLKHGASKAFVWYEGLSLPEKILWAISPASMLGKEVAKQLTETARTLWARREQLMNLLKAFFEGTAEAIEKALEALVDLPGELGELFRDLVKNSRDWVQNMIEVASETDVLKRATKTIMSIVMMMTPNFWAEGIGMVEGYLLPEVLITIALIIIGAFCAAAGASTLAARIVETLSRLRKAISAAGRAGQVFANFYSKVSEIAKLIGNLSKVLRRRVNQAIKGTTDRLNNIIRRSKKIPARLDESMRHARPAEQRTAQRLTNNPDFHGRTLSHPLILAGEQGRAA